MNSSETEPSKSPPKRPNILLRLLGPGLVMGGRRRRSVRHRDLFSSRSAIWIWPAVDGLSDDTVHDRNPARQRSNRPRDRERHHRQRKCFVPRWLVISVVAMLVMANTFNIAADLAAMGEALSLVIGGLDHEHSESVG